MRRPRTLRSAGSATVSAVHHHGHTETGIYVVSGTPTFVFRDPSPGTEAVRVLARSTQEAIVVNLDRL